MRLVVTNRIVLNSLCLSSVLIQYSHSLGQTFISLSFHKSEYEAIKVQLNSNRSIKSQQMHYIFADLNNYNCL